jgi:predicted nucleic acid-binding protein
MKKIFLDTNILLDYYLNRSGADAVEKIFILSNAGKLFLFASTLTYANFAYVIKREHSKEELYAILDEVEKHIYALPMDKHKRLC